MNTTSTLLLIGLLVAGLLSFHACQTLTGAEPPPTQPAVAAPMPDPAPRDTAARPYYVVGYHPSWMGDAWQTYDWHTLDEILFFDLPIAEDGSLAETNGWPEAWTPLREAAAAHGVRLAPTVSMFDPESFEVLFESRSARATLRETLLTLVQDPAVGGLHLDFEIFDPVSIRVRGLFADFVATLSADLAALGGDKKLSAFVVALDLPDAYDEAVLAQAVDFLVVQGYDLHWKGGPAAGPVAALRGWGQHNWEAIVARYRALGVPAEKIVLSVPYYGYEWPTESDAPGAATRGEGRIVPFVPVEGLGPSVQTQRATYGERRDSVSGSPYYAFEGPDGWYQGWYEDATSLQAKYNFVKAQGLGGVAIFPLSYGDGSLTTVLEASFGTTLASN